MFVTFKADFLTEIQKLKKTLQQFSLKALRSFVEIIKIFFKFDKKKKQSW